MDPIIVEPEEIKSFHLIDRQLYTVLAMHLWRDPVECIKVVGLWLWLEQLGFGDIIKNMLSLPSILINELADEAVLCINLLENPNFASFSNIKEIPMIQSLLEKEISLQFFLQDRSAKSQAFSKVVNEICHEALGDIMHSAIQRNSNQAMNSLPNFQPSMVHSRFSPNRYVQNSEVPQEDRTMFVTFSKGYPVFEWEIRDFFTIAYGEHIEAFYMQEVKNNEQALFARVVFSDPSVIDMILQGVDKAKFTINGKHVWARKFVPNRPRTSFNAPPLSEFP